MIVELKSYRESRKQGDTNRSNKCLEKNTSQQKTLKKEAIERSLTRARQRSW